MAFIEYHTVDTRDLELIRPLWKQLNTHHHALAKTFRSQYERWTFDDRKAYFEKLGAAGSLRVDLASDPETRRCVGYCVSSLSPEKTGELESIFIEEGCCSRGIGSVLVTRALAWLDSGGSIRNRVSVADGNEMAWEFYRKFGFSPRMTILEQKMD
ncbi:GNAT family N-acetyltransferase [uncultured Methanoregula sp.]|uniref:GNAT family N-acetyltransferase n=1 Tax=uncultured Methanoregula sp. TaxID=1005933 RepID=UPI002AAA7C0A|nr:GNAT family N-acetyltransferase [uncultured Methanoregula sp.]